MRRNTRYFYFLLIIIILYCSCSTNDSPYEYARASRNNGSNLNMKGKPLRTTSTESMAKVQENLHVLGYDPGPVNGCCGPQTKRAIKRFQAEHGIKADGTVGPLTEESIRKAIHARATLQKHTPARIKSTSASSQ